MDDLRLGRACRALRRRRGWRQVDLATRAACHQTTISRLERGELGRLSIETMRAIFSALEARFEGQVQWRGADLDRLLDEAHAGIVESVARILTARGWVAIPEASFSRWGERGSIDLLGWHPGQEVAVVVEVKTVIGDVQELLHRHDVKARLARSIVVERTGVSPRAVVRLLVIADERTNRRAVDLHARTFRSVYPAGSREVRAWIGNPAAARSGIWFLTGMPGRHVRGVSGGRIRIRVPQSADSTHGSAPAGGPGAADRESTTPPT